MGIVLLAVGFLAGWKVGEWIRKKNLSNAGRFLALIGSWVAGFLLAQISYTIFLIATDSAFESRDSFRFHKYQIGALYAVGMMSHFLAQAEAKKRSDAESKRSASQEAHRRAQAEAKKRSDAESKRSASQEAHRREPESPEAHRVLGTKPEFSDEEVKRHWREKLRKYHPDRVEALGDEFKVLAEEKTKALNSAYGQIKRARGIR